MSEKIYKIGVAGLIHGHIGGLMNDWRKHERAEVVAVAEPDDDLAQNTQEHFQIGRRYTDWREMLGAGGFDILQVGTDNAAKTEIIVAALEAGIPVAHEKPLAVSLAAAIQIRDAVRRTGTPFLTNWWPNWQPERRTLLRLAQEGAIGTVWQFKDRFGHAGPKEIGCGVEFWTWLHDADRNGGGAGADFCGYGAVQAAMVMGRPQSVWGTAGNFTKPYSVPDDNAVFVAQYPKGVALIEGTWAQQADDGVGYPILYGTAGTLSLEHGKVRLAKPDGVQIVEPEALPVGETGPAAYFIRCIESGVKPEGMLSLENCFIAQEIVEAGYQSARTGASVTLS